MGNMRGQNHFFARNCDAKQTKNVIEKIDILTVKTSTVIANGWNILLPLQDGLFFNDRKFL